MHVSELKCSAQSNTVFPKIKFGAGEMAQCYEHLLLLQRLPAPTSGDSEPPVTAVPGDLLPSGLSGLLQRWCVKAHSFMYTHMNRNKYF